MAVLEQVLDLNTTGFEDIVGCLKAFEERVTDEEEDNKKIKASCCTLTMNHSQLTDITMSTEAEAEEDVPITEDVVAKDTTAHIMEKEMQRELHVIDATRLDTLLLNDRTDS